MADQIILFQHVDFRGAHRHVFDSEENLNAADDSFFNDKVSSIVVVSGNWRLFKDSKFENPYPVVLGPGLYRRVSDVQITNDDLSSLQTVPDAPTTTGVPLDAHAVLFQHANFHGDHRHVFTDESNLGGNGFNDITSSIVVEEGNWSFFRDSEFDGHYPPVLGPGIYPWVENVGIKNDDLSSLRPTVSPATLSNAVDNEVVLFRHAKFHGAHKHVFAAEPNLNAGDDSAFNDAVSSLVVLRGSWSFFADSAFIGSYPAPPLGPGAYSSVSDQGIQNDDLSSLRPSVPTATRGGQRVLGHVILFEHRNFHGAHKHVFNSEANLNASEDGFFNDKVSSIVVVTGNWQFFRNSGFEDDYPSILGPGIYPLVSDVSIRNDDMSSLRVTQLPANARGAPLDAHIVLFEHRDFHGAHKHVFAAEPNLNAGDDSSFNDKVSSVVVLAGTWATFADSNFARQYWPLIGPGRYPWVEDIGIKNDDLSSLQPSRGRPSVNAPPVTAHALLFEHVSFRGAHKHVFAAEPNLNAADDSFFNDKVSSIAVLLEQWRVYRDSKFRRRYDVILGGGLFPKVSDVGITNDDLSSLELAGTFVQFTGTVTLQLDDSRLPDPVVRNAPFTFLFFSDTRLARIDSFSDVVLNGDVTAQFKSAGDGSFPADGTMTIPDMLFNIAISIPLASDSTAKFSLSTGSATSPTGRFTVTGSPADVGGAITLVGTGALIGGSLAGEDYSISFSGTIAPRPA